MQPRLTQDEFLSRCHKVLGERFDLSKAVYVDRKTPVELICPQHGSFFIKPISIYYNGGVCPKCRYASVKEQVRLSQDEFLRRATAVWGDRFDLSEAKYEGGKHNIKVICPKHGPFIQVADAFLRHRCGCKQCYEEEHGVQNRERLTQEEYLSRAASLWNGRYGLTKTVYVDSRTDVIVTCPTHGDFTINARGFLRGNGCYKCGIESAKQKNSLSTEEFVQRARLIHGDKYDYSKVEYTVGQEKVSIICPIHGEFLQKGNSHLNGEGCPTCSSPIGETKIRLFLERNNIQYETQKQFEGCVSKSPLRFDFYIPSKNVCVEYQGVQHYEPVDWFGGEKGFKDSQLRDQIKRDYCASHGIQLIEIRYDENIEEKLKQVV